MSRDLLSAEDLNLFTSGAFFVFGAIHLDQKMDDAVVTYDLFVRDMPETRNYLVFGGLDTVVDYLKNLKFNDEHIAFLEKNYGFSPEVLEYYRNFRFTGDIWAMPEGTVFSPGVPLIRVTAPIIEAQIIERYLINTVMSQTVIASKLSRYVQSAQGKVKTGLNSTRCHGAQATLLALKMSKIVGIDLAAAPFGVLKYGLNTDSGGTSHSFIVSFPTEEDALRAYCKFCKGKGYWLVDTYNTRNGVRIFARVAKEMKDKDLPYPAMIIFDSGDVTRDSIWARKILDKASLEDVKIAITGNMDEHKVREILKKKVPVSVIVGGTELITSPDSPKLEVVYKLGEIVHQGKIMPKMKLATGKVSLPGRKQVYRIELNGLYSHDVIGLENEKIAAKQLLVPIIQGGALVCDMPSLDQIRQYHLAECAKFKKSLFSVRKKSTHPVKISPKLRALARKTKQEIHQAHGIS